MSRWTMAVSRPLTAAATAVLVLMGALAGFFAPAVARADSAPLDPTVATTPTTVSADALPTVQINGVAWAQVVVGNTVYVAGKFSSARPAGVSAGTQETTRNNLLAYDIRTGGLITSFAPSLNAQAVSLAASPDGSRLYVGGDFTVANGQARYRVAAFSTSTGQLIPGFAPAVDAQVRAIAASDTTVYLGGNISAVGSAPRNRLAAVRASDGALLPWAPQPGVGSTAGNRLPNRPDINSQTSNQVMAMVLAGPSGQVVVGGRFDSLNGTKATGVGALDGVSGATRPFAVNKFLTNQGVNSAVYSLSTDGTNVYGTAYDYWGPGDLEGTFVASADGGAVGWFTDCRGDTYSAFPVAGVVYTTSHAHDCRNIGSFAETAPQSFWHANAFSAARYTVNTRENDWNGGRLAGQPAPAHLAWHPAFEAGSFTGQYQAGWSVSGNADYVVYGGEFPYVNDRAQQGLVRFPMPRIAPNKVGPSNSSSLTPTATAIQGGVRLSWKSTWDKDNEHLTYRVYRDDTGTTPACQVTGASRWWSMPTYGCSDTSATAGSHRYLVSVTDAFGNTVNSAWTTFTVPTTSAGTASRDYERAVASDGATNLWTMGESSGSTAFDHAGSANMTLNSGVTRGVTGAVAGDGNKAFRFSGTTSGYLSPTAAAVTGPQTFSVEAWFQTTTTSGGKIVGWANARTGTSTVYDRHIYMDAQGRVYFGVYNGAIREVHTTAALNDGKWHHAVGMLSRAGMSFYVDGALVGTRADVISAEASNGYWRIGGDTSWQTGLDFFAGQIDEVAVYPRALSAGQVAGHYKLGATGQLPNTAPTAAFDSSVNGLTVSVDGSGSTDAQGPVASYAWEFGDGSTGTGAMASHTYAAAGTYPVKLTVTDSAGATGTVTTPVTVAAAPQSTALATDAFGREVTGGWGTADVGGAWTVTGASAAGTVTGGSGRINAAPGATSAAVLPVSAQDVSVQTDVLVEKAPAGGGSFVSLVGRNVGASTRYTAQLRYSATGSVTLSLTSVVNGTESVLGSYRMPANYTPGSVLKVRFEAVGNGTTTLRAKVWASGALEPAWQATATDSTAALQKPGALRFDLYNSGTATGTQTLRVDNLQATRLGAAPPPANTAPTAAFTSSVNGLAVSVDGSGSADAEGAVASYAWEFGDGSTGAGATASRTYAAAGTYAVKLTVTDAAGATGTVTKQVTVSAAPPANTAPTAAFTSSVNGLAVSVDGSGSADAEGAVASYAWEFGDGSTGAGATASRTYAAAGTYAVKLTVTDAAGATGTVTKQVTVTAPTTPPVSTALAADAFGREVTGGWGTADVGGAWTVVGGVASAAVTGGSGRLTAAVGGTTTASLPVSVQDVALQADVLLEKAPTGGGTYVSLVGRNTGSSTRYTAELRFSATGSVTMSLLSTVNGTQKVLGSYRMATNYTPGSVLKVRFETAGSGTTTLRAMVWASGSTEPADWQVSATDATVALQKPGTVRVDLYNSGTATGAQTVRVDDVWVGAAGTKP